MWRCLITCLGITFLDCLQFKRKWKQLFKRSTVTETTVVVFLVYLFLPFNHSRPMNKVNQSFRNLKRKIFQNVSTLNASFRKVITKCWNFKSGEFSVHWFFYKSSLYSFHCIIFPSCPIPSYKCLKFLPSLGKSSLQNERKKKQFKES